MNIFWRNTRTEKHRPDDPDPLLSPDVPTAVVPTPEKKSTKNTCAECGAVLLPSGEHSECAVLTHKRHEEEEKKALKEKADLLERENAELKAKLAPPVVHSTKKNYFGFKK